MVISFHKSFISSQGTGQKVHSYIVSLFNGLGYMKNLEVLRD
jgi:hypothetical protein